MLKLFHIFGHYALFPLLSNSSWKYNNSFSFSLNFMIFFGGVGGWGTANIHCDFFYILHKGIYSKWNNFMRYQKNFYYVIKIVWFSNKSQLPTWTYCISFLLWNINGLTNGFHRKISQNLEYNRYIIFQGLNFLHTSNEALDKRLRQWNNFQLRKWIKDTDWKGLNSSRKWRYMLWNRNTKKSNNKTWRDKM